MNREERFQKGLDRILAREPGYTAGAYRFLRDAVAFAGRKRRETKYSGGTHISCVELLDSVRRCAMDRYGPLALQVLNEWGIKTTLDVGRVVFLMIEEGLFAASESDSLNDFRDVFDLHDILVKPFMPANLETRVPVIDADAE